MPHSSTKEITYRLVYGVDVVISIELTESSLRIMTMTKEYNELTWRAELDLDRGRSTLINLVFEGSFFLDFCSYHGSLDQ